MKVVRNLSEFRRWCRARVRTDEQIASMAAMLAHNRGFDFKAYAPERDAENARHMAGIEEIIREAMREAKRLVLTT